jgi:DNA-binding NarL/FixJ family response regulator
MSERIATVRALIVDPRPLFRTALQACLTKVGGVVVEQCADFDEACQRVEMLKPDLMVLGPHLAEAGLSVCREIYRRLPTLKVIIFTAHADNLLFQADAVYAGVAACVRPEITDEELLTVVARVMVGERLFSPEIFALAFQPIDLTGREREVLRLMVNGKSDREIAHTLKLKFNTVRNHTQHILEKLGVHSRQEAVWRARHRGLV